MGWRACFECTAVGKAALTASQLTAEAMLFGCAGRTTEDQIAELMQLFAKRKFVRKADRKYKKPKPGKKRLVKFPRTLVPHPVRNGSISQCACACVGWTAAKMSRGFSILTCSMHAVHHMGTVGSAS